MLRTTNRDRLCCNVPFRDDVRTGCMCLVFALIATSVLADAPQQPVENSQNTPAVTNHAAFPHPAAHDSTNDDSGPPQYWQPGTFQGRPGSPYYYSAEPDSMRTGTDVGLQHRLALPAPRFGQSGNCGCDGDSAHTWTPLPSGYHARPGHENSPYVGDLSGGFDRRSDFGHTRYPYYSYRRPWYFPGPRSRNGNTNLVW